MNPADIPFWGWLIISAACGILWLICLSFSTSERFGGWALFLSVVASAAGFISLLIGAVRFVKWVWA